MDIHPRRRSVLCSSPRGLHRIAYLEWGDPRNGEVLVCVHGLTRCARDFDPLAQVLAQRYRVVCPDLAGRGDSDWLADPMLYQPPQYVSDMVTLIARLEVPAVHWLGTSLGGIVGMLLAADKASPIATLMLNDIGAVVTRASLARIATYVGLAPAFRGIEEAGAYVREVSSAFGPHSDEGWRFLTEISVRRNPDGGWRMHYDPALGETVRKTLPAADLDLWPVWDAIRCPTLVLRGAESDLLTQDTALAMRGRGPRATLVEIPEAGHAPTFLREDSVRAVHEFLLKRS